METESNDLIFDTQFWTALSAANCTASLILLILSPKYLWIIKNLGPGSDFRLWDLGKYRVARVGPEHLYTREVCVRFAAENVAVENILLIAIH
jgi:hypothetical protein